MNLKKWKHGRDENLSKTGRRQRRQRQQRRPLEILSLVDFDHETLSLVDGDVDGRRL